MKKTTGRRSKARTWIRRIALGVGTLLVVLAISLLVIYLIARPALGQRPDGDRLVRAQQSPQWKGDSFTSGRESWMGDAFGTEPQPGSAPPPAVPVVRTDAAILRSAPTTGLRVTWFGHSSTLVQVDGINVLTDPFWSERATPIGGLGPERWYAPPIVLKDLPKIDAVVVSHDHYDHLDRPTIQALNRGATRFIVPLGVGAHLESWGVPAERIVELDWWGSVAVGKVRIHATPARHYSGRFVPRDDTSLWAGYAMIGPKNRVYYTGDTSYMPEMAEIGRRLGPFDLALTDSGQYNAAWPDVHLGPEQAVGLAEAVGAKTVMPVHWGLIRLASHTWPEPAERTLAAAACTSMKVVIPEPGRSIEPASHTRPNRWWPAMPWQTAAEAPIRSTQNGDGAARFELDPCKR